MTRKFKKSRGKKGRRRPANIARLHASIGDELLLLADGEPGAQPRWDRPRKRRLSMRVDAEVLDWFKSRGPGYQTRINRILRRVMLEGKKRSAER